MRAGAGMTSTVSAKRQRSTEAVGVPILDEVHPVWLEAAPRERWAQIPHSRHCESFCREGTVALGNDDSLNLCCSVCRFQQHRQVMLRVVRNVE